MRITMVGTGYVGLVTGTCFANTGNDVVCLDVDSRKIDLLNSGKSPIYEPGLDELIRMNVRAKRLHFSTDKTYAYDRAEIIFICVGTPSDERGHADLKYVLQAASDIGHAIEKCVSARPKIVVIKSTVPVGTNAKVKAQIAHCTSKPFFTASNPEFLKEGAAISDFNKPDRVVIGVDDKATGERLRDLYEPFVRQGNPIFLMDILSAEMVKYAANAMLATKISFINEIANLCEAFGADIDEVRRGMCSDKRIGNQFLFPGLGYGGSCFPKDVLACINMGQTSRTPVSLLAAVHQVNQQQRRFFMNKIDCHFARALALARSTAQVSAVGNGQAGLAAQHGSAPAGDEGDAVGFPGHEVPACDLTGKHFAIWGVAFKPGTDDVREAPSVTLIHQLLQRGATVAAYDPVAHETCRQVLGEKLSYAEDPLSALDGAAALVLCTDWDEFKNPDFEEMKKRMARPAVIFDGRNIYRPELMREFGFVYYSVGRSPIR